MAEHQLIRSYLAELAGRLPRDTVAELADGLTETWHRHRHDGLTDDQAAVAAVAEFGTPDRIRDEFVAQSPGRRTARLLLATGPIVGACWGAGLVTGHVSTRPVPASAGIGFAVVLLGVVAALIAAATSRHSYRRTGLGIAGAAGLLLLDAVMIGSAATATAAPGVPLAAAVLLSLARITFTLRSLRQATTR